MSRLYQTWKSSRYRRFDAGPSDTSHSPESRDIELREISVSRPDVNISDSTSSVPIPKLRPLNVADNFEIVGDVPAFVWEDSEEYNPFCYRYVISYDGTRIAIQEGCYKVCIYDMLDNFSLVAKWEDAGSAKVEAFTFYNNQNNELVVVFEDSTVALILVSSETNVRLQEAISSHLNIEAMKPQKKILIFDMQDKYQTQFDIANEGPETWVAVYERNIKNSIVLLSISKDGLRELRIKSNHDIIPSRVHFSISQRVLMLVSEGACLDQDTTRLYFELDFKRKVIEDSPAKKCGKSFGFSKCGKYFLVWRYEHNKEHEIELHDTHGSKTSLEPVARRSIGRCVYIARGQFVKQDNYPQFFDGGKQENSPIVALMVAKSAEINLIFWDPLANTMLKKLDLTMKEINLSNPVQIEFCISSNGKWVAIGCCTQGALGLFSILTESLVWSHNVSKFCGRLSSLAPPMFDTSSTRLIVNASKALYVFCPPCLIEGYTLEFRSDTYHLVQDLREERRCLELHQCSLIPKHILNMAIISKYGIEGYKAGIALDASGSKHSPNVAVLLDKHGFLNVLIGPATIFFTSSFQDFISYWPLATLPRGIMKLIVNTNDKRQSRSSSDGKIAWVFLYPVGYENEDMIVVFLNQNGFQGIFIDFSGMKNQEQVCFSTQKCFAIKQNKNGSTVYCLFACGVMIIDLRGKTVRHEILYNADLNRWLVAYISNRGEGCFDITNDGETILIGWNTKDKSLRTITSKMNEEDCEIVFKEEAYIVPTWLFYEHSRTFTFLEFNEDNPGVLSICVYNLESNISNNFRKKITREQWNTRTQRIIDSMTSSAFNQFTLHLDENNGHLWILALERRGDAFYILFVPIHPYSLEGCIPCLCPHSFEVQNLLKLDELAVKFGPSLFNMLFNRTPNLEYAFRSLKDEVLAKLFDLALQEEAFSAKALTQAFERQLSNERLRKAIINKNEVIVNIFLHILEEKSLSFESQAFALKVGFEGLWMNYRRLLEDMIVNKTLEWKLCQIKLPSDIYTKNAFIEARIGTTNAIPLNWQGTFDQDTATSYWESLNEELLINIRRRGGNETTIAVVIFFSIASVCKIGLNGIIRFLLMQEAPSYIFKTSLLKWVITYKWEKIWKKRSFRNLIIYLIFMGVYSSYSIWIAFVRKSLGQDMPIDACLTILLLILMIFASMWLYKEIIQLKTYVKDGKKLFPKGRSWGLRKYCTSIWNLVEVVSYIMVILVIPILHFANLFGLNVISILYACIALESILIWIKVWYFAQAFEKTGAFVLMIENIVKDCVPFLGLAFVVLFGFSFALFVLFQQTLHEKKSGSDEGDKSETIHSIERSFGDPWKTVVTMFYAMIGTFEPEVYYNSGSLSILITIMFSSYLAIQMIVMVNMLIAIMGDTFDRVKSTEEEQSLMGRARFIDACEAQLRKKDIEAIEEFIGRYLYVLLPKDEEITDDMKLWQGRVKTIEDSVGSMIKDLQKEVMKKIKESTTSVKEEIAEFKQMKEDTKQMKKDLEKMKGDINEIKQVKEDTEQIKEKFDEFFKIKDTNLLEELNKEMKKMKRDMEQIKELLLRDRA